MKLKLISIFLLIFLIGNQPTLFGQGKEMFKGTHKQKHRKRGNRERKNKTAYNPYIDADTGKPKKIASKKLEKENKKAIKEQKKMVRREKRKLRRQGKGFKK
jgi:hypothetical protein